MHEQLTIRGETRPWLRANHRAEAAVRDDALRAVDLRRQERLDALDEVSAVDFVLVNSASALAGNLLYYVVKQTQMTAR